MFRPGAEWSGCAAIRNFPNLARIEIFWQGFATGGISLVAVLLEALQRRISRRI